MKILIIQPWISYRGAETLSLNQARGLLSLGHQASVLALFVDWQRLDVGVKKIDFITPPVWISRWCQRSNIFLFVFGFLVMLYLVVKHGKNFDVLNPHNFPSVWAAGLAKLVIKKPVAWTVHNFPQHGFVEPTFKRLWEWATWWLDQKFVSLADNLVVVSPKVGRQVAKLYQRQAKVVLPGVDCRLFLQGNKNLANIFLNGKKFIFCSSKLSETKNHLLLLKAFAGLKKIHLLIAGEGRAEKKLKRTIKLLGIKKRVLFLNYVAKERLRHFYKAAEILVLPAQFGEGFNLAVLESLCVGVPAVVVKGSGVDEWIIKNKVGWVAENKISCLTLTLKKVLSDKKEIRRRGRKGRRLVLAQHNLKTYAQEWLKSL